MEQNEKETPEPEQHSPGSWHTIFWQNVGVIRAQRSQIMKDSRFTPKIVTLGCSCVPDRCVQGVGPYL